jgi:hypothetical protein
LDLELADMTQEDMIRMAREAFIARGFWPNEVMWACWRDAWLAGAAAENEACAKVCEDSVEYAGDTLAQAIRARGQA